MSSHFYKSPLIRRSDLERFSEQNSSLISRYGAEQEEDVLIRGNFAFHQFDGGFSIHSSQATEQNNSSNCFELPAGLSFNFIFRGSVNVTLAGQAFCLTAGAREGCISCSASTIVLNQSDFLMRHMKQGMELHKVNIFVNRHWLETHCTGGTDAGSVDALFQDHARVIEWTPSAALVSEVAEWFDEKASTSLAGQLNTEAKGIRLLSSVLDEYITSCRLDMSSPRHSKKEAGNGNLKHAVDSCMASCTTVREVAEALHLSPSALQRRFRRNYNMTVVDYLRLRRLQQARAALLRDRVTIGEAAWLAGYNHTSNFITAFRKCFSVTPMELLRSGKKHNG